MGRKKGFVFSLITMIIEISSAMVLSPLIISRFGQSEFGVYSLAISITSYLVLLDLGIGQSFVRFMSKYVYENDLISQRKYLGIVSFYYLICSIVIIFIGAFISVRFPFLFARGLTSEETLLGQKLIIILTLNMAITVATYGFYYTVVSYERFDISSGLLAFLSIFRILFSILLLNNGHKSTAISGVTLLFSFIWSSILVLSVSFKLKIRPSLKRIDYSQVKALFSFSFFVFLQTIAAQMNKAADQILIGALVKASSSILAVYAIGSLVNSYFLTVGMSINGVLMPGVVKLVEKEKNNENSSALQHESVRIGRFHIIILGLIWIVFFVNGREFIFLWAGKENIDAYYVALILMFPYILIQAQGICTQMLWALNKHKIIAIVKIATIFLSIFLRIFLIKWNPLFGATIGTFITLVIGDILLAQFFIKVELKINLVQYYYNLFKGILPSLSISLLVGAVLHHLLGGALVYFIFNCFIMITVYLVSLVLFGFSKFEKELIQKAVNRLLPTKRS